MGSALSTRNVSRGTSQGGVLSPLLWVLVVNKLLSLLEEAGTKVVAYADDVVILLQGKFPQTLCNLMETALSTLSRWTAVCGLGVNPEKTELVLFTRKYKIPNLILPKLHQTRLNLSNQAMYLGVFLDKKLLWTDNILDRTRKAVIALFACKKAIGRKWGFSPMIVHWLYTAIVRPILLYGNIVWWHSIEKNCSLRILDKIQGSAELCISGALRTTATEALNTILDLQPLDLLPKTGHLQHR